MSRDHAFLADAIPDRCAVCGEPPGGRHHIRPAVAAAPALAVAKGVEARIEADATAGTVAPAVGPLAGDTFTTAPGSGWGFGRALGLLKQGALVRRRGWRGRFLTYIAADAYTAPPMAKRAPWFGMVTAAGAIVPWTPSHGDLDAEDWQEVQNGPV